MPGSSVAGAFTSKYSIDGRDVSLQQYNDRLKTFGILVKAKNFLVFQVGLQGRCCSPAAGFRPSCGICHAALRHGMHSSVYYRCPSSSLQRPRSISAAFSSAE